MSRNSQYASGEIVAIAYSVDGEEIGRGRVTSTGPDFWFIVRPEAPSRRADVTYLMFVPIELTDGPGTL